jgi:hypothetical protein
MDEPNYKRIGQLFLAECNEALSLIRKGSDFNKGLYAFCIDLDPHQGGFRISWNTEDAFHETAKFYNGRGHDWESLYEFPWGTKYNSGDFTFHLDKFQVFDESLSELDSLCNSHAELCFQLVSEALDEENHPCMEDLNQKFIDQAVWAIKNLDFTGVDCTSNFISFVTLHDADDVTLLNLFSKTISSSVLKQYSPRADLII